MRLLLATLVLLLPVASGASVDLLAESARATGDAEASLEVLSLRILSPAQADGRTHPLVVDGSKIRVEAEHQDGGAAPLIQVEPEHTNRDLFSGAAHMQTERSGDALDLYLWSDGGAKARIEDARVDVVLRPGAEERTEGPDYIGLERETPQADTSGSLSVQPESGAFDLVVEGPVAFSLWDWDLSTSDGQGFWSGVRQTPDEAAPKQERQMLFVFVDAGTVRVRIDAETSHHLLVGGGAMSLAGTVSIQDAAGALVQGPPDFSFTRQQEYLHLRSISPGTALTGGVEPTTATTAPAPVGTTALALSLLLLVPPVALLVRRERRWRELNNAFEVGFFPHVVDTAPAYMHGRRRGDATRMHVVAALNVFGPAEARTSLTESGHCLDDGTRWFLDAMVSHAEGDPASARDALARCLSTDASFEAEIARNPALRSLVDVRSDGYS